MARTFARGSSQYLENGSAVVTAFPFTMACWFYTANIANQQTLMALGSTSEQDMWVLFADGASGGDPVRIGNIANGAGHYADTTTGYSANTWHHACGVFTAADDRAVFIDGGSKGTVAVGITPDAIDTTDIGAYMYNGGRGWYMDGSIGEAAIWNVALTDAEVAVLALGYSPLFVRPQNLVAYWPLIRDNDNDIVGGYDLTAANNPTVAAHPPVVMYPGMAHAAYKAPAAGPTLSVDRSVTNFDNWTPGVRIK